MCGTPLSATKIESMQFSFAVNSADRELYFLLNKTALMTRSEDMDSSLASYMHFNQKVSFTRFLRDNWIIVLSIISAVFLLIVLLLLQRLKAERRLNEQQRMMEPTKRRRIRWISASPRALFPSSALSCSI